MFVCAVGSGFGSHMCPRPSSVGLFHEKLVMATGICRNIQKKFLQKSKIKESLCELNTIYLRSKFILCRD